MVVPLWSHVTDLCLLRGVQAAGQSRPSLSLHPSLCLALSRPRTHAFVSALQQIACVRPCMSAAASFCRYTCGDRVPCCGPSCPITNHVPLVLLLSQGLWLQAQVG